MDVTLREGDQQPGRDYDLDAKLEAGRALDRLGIGYLQAGFPATGERDREAIATLAAECDAAVVGLARALPSDVDAALDAEADVVDVFAPLGTHHLDRVLGKTREGMIESVRDALDRVDDAGATAHLSLLDAFRTDPEHVRRAFATFPDVEYVTLADTVGVRTPARVARRLSELDEHVDLSRAGVHFHDDLGVATANALVAADAGVGKADVSVAGLGERAGNVPLEELVVATAIADDDPGPDPGPEPEPFGIDADGLVPVCEAVLAALEEPVPERKPVLGAEVTRHESGLHTAAMLDDPSTFEPYAPDRFGGSRELVFGVGTGRRGASRLLERAGAEPTPDAVEALLERLAANGPVTTDEAVELAAAVHADGPDRPADGDGD
nr:citramalate synthase [Halorubrum sp. JWXQ-INN 858]